MVQENGILQFQAADITIALSVIAQDDQEIEFGLCLLKTGRVISQSTFRVVWDTDAKFRVTNEEEKEMTIKVRLSRAH